MIFIFSTLIFIFIAGTSAILLVDDIGQSMSEMFQPLEPNRHPCDSNNPYHKQLTNTLMKYFGENDCHHLFEINNGQMESFLNDLTSAQGINLNDESGCQCSDDYEPVCCQITEVTYRNQCKASCENLCPNIISGECGNENDNSNSDDSRSQLEQILNELNDVQGFDPNDDTGCICGNNYEPVCCDVTQTTYSNACIASCNYCMNLTPGECDDGQSDSVNSSSDSADDDDDDCVCMFVMESDPVCCDATQITYSNACKANCDRCFLHSDGECDTNSDNSDSNESSDNQSDDGDDDGYDPACICPANFDPVCCVLMSDGQMNTIFSNSCLAACAKCLVHTDGNCPIHYV